MWESENEGDFAWQLGKRWVERYGDLYIYMGASDLSGAFFFFCVSCAVSLSLFYSKSQSSQLSTLVNSRVGVFWKIHFLFGCTFILVFTRNGIRFFSFFFLINKFDSYNEVNLNGCSTKLLTNGISFWVLLSCFFLFSFLLFFSFSLKNLWL